MPVLLGLRAPVLAVAALGAAAAVVGVRSPVAEVRSVSNFVGVHADDGIKVHVSVVPGADFSLRVSANANFLSEVKSRMDSSTLVLEIAEGRKSSCVVADIVVPEPLLYATASGGARMMLESVAGPLAALMGGAIHVGSLTTQEPVSIVADTHATVSIADGKVGSIIVSCSGGSSVDLGSVEASGASVSVFHRSSAHNLTVGNALISASGMSSVSVAASGAVVLMCSRSEVAIQGSASVMRHASSMCVVEVNGSVLPP